MIELTFDVCYIPGSWPGPISGSARALLVCGCEDIEGVGFVGRRDRLFKRSVRVKVGSSDTASPVRVSGPVLGAVAVHCTSLRYARH